MKTMTSTLGWCLVAILLAGEPAAGEPAAGEPAPQDRAAILAMAGTFTVDFHFQETVAFEAGYEPKPAYDAAGMELVSVLEDTGTKIVLQHVLQTEHGIVKHWRQDWLYENDTLWEYKGDHSWRKRVLPREQVAGTWTQRVFQVDDSPRYESFGRWQHRGNLSEWESAPTDRPVPRRDATKRDDYNILAARNRHALTLTGWVHEQDNVKLHREGEKRRYIVREVGVNRYDRTLATNCEKADRWWQEHSGFWQEVRGAWDEVLAANQEIRLARELDGKSLFKNLSEIGEEAVAGDQPADRARIKETIARFMTEAGEPAKRTAMR